MAQFRTDLALEAFDGQGGGLPGIEVRHWETGGITLTEVNVSDAAAGEQIGKPRGIYLTMECAGLKQGDPEARLAMASLLPEELSRLLPDISPAGCALVIGLGNRAITPDALGPAVIDRTLVTRQLMDQPLLMDGLKPVCAIAPGVLGVTGIETMELAESLARLVKPDFILCVDSLAARSSKRIGTTLQLTDAGIQPGAGVGNYRRALTRQTVGVPVIAIGMPTVIHAATLARDAFAWLNGQDGEDDSREAALAEMERALLSSSTDDMIVTPREIDSLIEDAAGIIAKGINRALQPGLSEEELLSLMN